MPAEFLSLVGFAFAASITPGPNNLMLMASGTNYGLRRTVPHLLGVWLGFTLMLVLIGLGMGQLFDRFPMIELWLRGLCFAYLLYLAAKLAMAGSRVRGEDASTGRPLSFLQAAAFQWVNPKAWAMGLTAMGVYLPHEDWVSVVLVAAVFGLVNLPCISSWMLLGMKLRAFLNQPGRLRTFNVSMAVLLIASVVPALLSGEL
ncbi:MAG: LysE family translocator [Pseudomonadota bacterium]